MQVELLDATEDPTETVCRAARNDYMDEYGGDLPFEAVMDGIAGETMAEKRTTLIERLLDRGHFGPFEHPQATFHVCGVSRALMAQLTRHRHATFDVQSMRYVEFDSMSPEPGEGFVAIPELSTMHPAGKKAEVADDMADRPDDVLLDDRERLYTRALENAVTAYESLLGLGVAPENARMVLPIGTKVNIVFSMNARMLMHVADMRAAADAQWEIRQMTEAVLDRAAEWMPTTFAYYREELQGRKNRLAP